MREVRHSEKQKEAVNLRDGKRSGESQAKQGAAKGRRGSLPYLGGCSVLFQGLGQTLCVARALGKPKANETGPNLINTPRLGVEVCQCGGGQGELGEGLGSEGQHCIWKIEKFGFKCKSRIQM